jgi:hypothetical protein
VKEPWYCGVDGEQYGPYTWEQMLAMGAEGRLVPETFVRRESDRQWYSAAQVPGLLSRKAPVAVVAPSPAGGTSPGSASAGSPIPVGKVVVPGTSHAEPPIVVVAPPPTAVRSASMPTKSREPATESPAAAEPRPNSPYLLVGILAGTALAVMVLGGGIVATVWWLRAEVSVAKSQASSAAQVAIEDEVNPAGESTATGERAIAAESTAASESEDKSPQPAQVAALSSRDLAAARKTIAQQGRWTDAQRFGRYRAGSIDVHLVGIWLAADEAGTWVEPILPDRADGGGNEAGASGTGPAKYVFVELRFFNNGAVPQKFTSWNEAELTDAILANEDGAILPLVPSAQTPTARRLAETRILPGEAIHDRVVFAAPAAPFEKLKLVLAMSAHAESLKGHLALDVPVEYLFRRPAASSAPPAATVPFTARQVPADPAGAGLIATPVIAAAGDPEASAPAEAARAEAAPAAAPAKKKGPPSKEELNKLFEEFDKPAAADPKTSDE